MIRHLTYTDMPDACLQRVSDLAVFSTDSVRARAPSGDEVANAAAHRSPKATLDTIAIRNLRLMRVLEAIAGKFNEAGVALLVLKGGALQLTLGTKLNERPMDDLDILIHPEDLDQARAILKQLGANRGQPFVTEDFFPRFHYEEEFTLGSIYPVKIDLHVRPFRPLRYSRIVPAAALWTRAKAVSIGQATILVPSVEEMLIHLATHAAVHGYSRSLWLRDISLWTAAYRTRINWDRLLATVERWQLALPVRRGLECAASAFGPDCPPAVFRRLAQMRVRWRDRLALRQAPRDATHPIAHVLTNAVCTPGLRFGLAYLLAVAVPSRQHMRVWYRRRHWGWLRCAQVLRWLRPLSSRLLPRQRSPEPSIESAGSRNHNARTFVNRDRTAQAELAVPPRRKDLHEYELDGEVVLFDPDRGSIHLLNRTALEVWRHCNGRVTVGQIATGLVRSYQVSFEIALDHAEQLSGLFASDGLLTEDVAIGC